jgi:hypothetical protein
MNNATVTAAIRRFPLLGRPRPDCPPLPIRLKEIAHAADAAVHKLERGMHNAAHALNKAALIASDAGMADLAKHLCWQHIDAYRHIDRPLTILEARYMLEPVLNLSRLQIRADQGTPALNLVESMHQAISRRTGLTIGEHVLPTANLAGEQSERRKLREWVWLQLIGEGIRALALANRWADAAEHARTHNGVGAHLMEGRQAVIIAALIEGNSAESSKLLAETALSQPWEQQVAACLYMMITPPASTLTPQHLANALRRYAASDAAPNYASYRARLGLTVAILANATRPELAAKIVGRVAKHAIDSGDGYAARDVLGFREPIEGITEPHRTRLRQIAMNAGIGLGELPDEALATITATTGLAIKVLDVALNAKR